MPIFTRVLQSLDHLLAKASAGGLNEQDLLGARLAPDMLPLTKQVQIACDTAKLAFTRVAQTEPLPMADEETSIAELRDRIALAMTISGAPSRQRSEAGRLPRSL